MTPKQLTAIEKHGRNLLAIFTKAKERDPVKLCKKLRALEVRAHAVALRLCNGPAFASPESVDAVTDAILDKVNAVTSFRESGVPVFINRDARGHALKINDEYIRTGNVTLRKDWGGYGIIAPEIDAEGN